MTHGSALAEHVPSSAAVSEPLTALLVDADRSFVQFACEEIDQTVVGPVRLLHAASLDDADAVLAAMPSVSVVLLDATRSTREPLAWLRQRRASLQAGALLLVGDDSLTPQMAVETGVLDCLVKSRLDGGQLARAIGDAARREQTRRHLLQSREYFQSLIEHARDLITVLDADGGIVFQSPATAALLGTTPQSYAGRRFSEAVHPEDAAAARALVEAVLQRGATSRGTFRLPHSDGTLRVFEVVGSPMLTQDGLARAVLNAWDVTDRQRAEAALKLREAQLQQAQKLEAVGRLAGGIAHDFSNVLTVVTAACERIDERLAAGTATSEDVQVILRHCARATALTRQLLAFSRQQPVVAQSLDLGVVIARSAELLTELVGPGVAIEVDIEPGLRRIEADPVQMEQVLMNLAINARDAMAGGGRLRISARTVVPSPGEQLRYPALASVEYVKLDVSDTGHGMNAETQARAFEPFFTTKEPGRGTGLGLATVYGIITQQGGCIGIDSAPGRGTRFEIYLRTTEVGADDSVPPQVSMIPAVGAILLTEDDADVRSLVADMLGGRGFTVHEASGPAEALSVAAAVGHIDLLVTDLTMPGGSGRTLARQLSATHPGLKVLFISGYGDQALATDPLGSGERFLAKPFTRTQLLDAIAAHLR